VTRAPGSLTGTGRKNARSELSAEELSADVYQKVNRLAPFQNYNQTHSLRIRSDAVERSRAAGAEKVFTILGMSLFAFMLVAALVEVSAFLALRAYHASHSDPLAPQQSPVYDSESWGREFWTEQTSFWTKARSTYPSFTIWGVRQWHGKYINTDEMELGTFRRTIQSMGQGCTKAGTRKVWVFGGSTVFGVGTPDSATLPSYLSRELNAHSSDCVELTNLGVEGYVTNQELILLLQQLKAGHRPDIAIFYDGVNESLVGGFSPGVATAHWYFELIRSKFENPGPSRLSCLRLLYSAQLIGLLKEKYAPEDRATISDGELAARAQATLQNYEANLKFVQLLASEYGFKTYFFWQPVLAYGNKPLAPFEQKLKEARSQELQGRVHRGLRAVYEQAERQPEASRKFVFLGKAFDEVKDSVYVDELHLAPRGNEIIAHTIAKTVEPALGSD
jgi:lysophospholipase L1-like esterase